MSKKQKYFGRIATDKVSGFQGIITGKCTYLYGCAQFLLTPLVDKDGKKSDGEWFDKGRLEIGEVKIRKEDVMDEDDPGGENREHPN